MVPSLLYSTLLNASRSELQEVVKIKLEEIYIKKGQGLGGYFLLNFEVKLKKKSAHILRQNILLQKHMETLLIWEMLPFRFGDDTKKYFIFSPAIYISAIY